MSENVFNTAEATEALEMDPATLNTILAKAMQVTS